MIGTKLKELLETRNIRVAELSRITGISPQTIYSLIKRNSGGVDIDTLLKICHALNVSPEYFGSDDVAHVTDQKRDALMALYTQLSDAGKDLLIGRANELIQLGYVRIKGAGVETA